MALCPLARDRGLKEVPEAIQLVGPVEVREALVAAEVRIEVAVVRLRREDDRYDILELRCAHPCGRLHPLEEIGVGEPEASTRQRRRTGEPAEVVDHTVGLELFVEARDAALGVGVVPVTPESGVQLHTIGRDGRQPHHEARP